jgi:hypothetical protein
VAARVRTATVGLPVVDVFRVGSPAAGQAANQQELRAWIAFASARGGFKGEMPVGERRRARHLKTRSGHVPCSLQVPANLHGKRGYDRPRTVTMWKTKP